MTHSWPVAQTPRLPKYLCLLALAIALTACGQTPGDTDGLPTPPPQPADPLLGAADLSFEGPLPLDPLALARLGRGKIMRLAFSPDGGLLAVGTNVGVYVYDAHTLGDVLFVASENPIFALGFSPDGKTLAAGMTGRSELILIDIASGEFETIPSGHIENIGICGVTYSADGSLLASSSYDDTVVVLDAATGEELYVVPGNGNVFNTTAFSPDGETLATAQDRGTLVFYDAHEGDLLRRMDGRELEGEIGSYGVAFTPDGARVASGGYGALNVWDAASGDTLLRVMDLPGHYQNVALLDGGKQLLAGNSLDNGGIWDVDSGRQIFSLPAEAVAASPQDEVYAVGSSRKGLSVIDAATRLPQGALGGHTGSIYTIAYAPDGETLFASTFFGEIYRWNMSTYSRSVFSVGTPDAAVLSMEVSPDGALLAAGHEDGQLALWDVASGRPLRTLAAQDSSIQGVAFSPDGSRVATSGSEDAVIYVWDVATGDRVARLDSGLEGVYSLAFVSRTQLAAGGEDVIQIWNVNSGIKTATLEGHSNRVRALALSPGGEVLLSGAFDGTGAVWDLDSGERLFTLNGGGSVPGRAAFSPDGQKMVLGLADGRVRVFDSETGEVLFTLDGHALPAWGVAFSPDSKLLVSASYDGTLVVWDMDR